MSSKVGARWNRTSESGIRQPEGMQRSLLDAPLWPHIRFAYEIAV
jgi:hypothetical protein